MSAMWTSEELVPNRNVETRHLQTVFTGTLSLSLNIVENIWDNVGTQHNNI